MTHPNARIAMMAFIGEDAWDSFSEGSFAYPGGLRDAVEGSKALAELGTWARARASNGQHYTHIGAVIFERDDDQPLRVVSRVPIRRPSAGA